jgi:hypothetical protein
MSQVQAAVAMIDVDALEKQVRQQQEKLLEMFGKKALPPGMGSIEDLKRQFEEQIVKMREGYARGGLPSGQLPSDRGSEGVFRVRFDPSGERLCLATTGGVRVYSWHDVLNADGDLRPELAVDIPGTMVETEQGMIRRDGYVYDFDLDRDRLLFGGLDGRVRYLDIDSGQSGVLLEPPALPPIHRLVLSRDRTTLALTTNPDMFAQGRNKRGPLIQFWDYQAISLAQAP